MWLTTCGWLIRMQLFPWDPYGVCVFLRGRRPRWLPSCRRRCIWCRLFCWPCYFWWGRWISDSGCDVTSMRRSYTGRRGESSIASLPKLRCDRLSLSWSSCMRDRWDCDNLRRDKARDCFWWYLLWNLFASCGIECTLNRDLGVRLVQFCGNGKICANRTSEHRLWGRYVEDCRWKIMDNLLLKCLWYFRS